MKIVGDRISHYYWVWSGGPAFADRFSTPGIRIASNVGDRGVVYSEDGKWLAL